MINLFFQGFDSLAGYQADMLERIRKRVHFDTCVLTDRSMDHSDEYDESVYTVIDYDMCTNTRYEYFMDMSDLMPLDREVLTAMEPYEPMCVRMLQRMSDFDMFTYEEAKRLYLQHLRYWNHIFTVHGINFVVCTGIPHHTHDYVIYALAKIRGIRTAVIAPTHPPFRCFAADDLYRLYERLDARYEELLKTDGDVTLPEDLETYYQALKRENKASKQKVMHNAASREEHAKREMRLICAYIVKDLVRKRYFKRLKHGLAESIRLGSLIPWHEAVYWQKLDAYFVARVRHKLKRCETLKEYNRRAVYPDSSERYVVFFLHQQPEATTMPQAGVFVEQELAVQLLAAALKPYGITLYVKEHFVQPYRTARFYEDIYNTDNVKLIRTDAESVDIMEHCIAAATPAGTVVLESIVNRKPVINFGHGGFEHGPGVYHVGNMEECRQAIESILKNPEELTEEKARKYFKAFADTSIYYYPPTHEAAEPDRVEAACRAVTDFICDRIEKEKP